VKKGGDVMTGKGRQGKSKLTKEEMIRMYEEGSSTTEIGKLAGISARYVNLVLKSNNVERRPRGSWKRQYSLNEHYFKTWTNNMAYILGFFVADGTIYRDMQTVSFSQKEPNILEAIKKEVGSNQPLYQNKCTGVYLLNLHSKIMKNDLMQLHGIMPNKSNDVEFPFVPDEYMSHFVRGYFDGDGFVKYPKYFVSFVGGSLSFMLSLKQVLEKMGFEPNFSSHKGHYRVYVSGRRTIKLFADWIYGEKGLHLKRKYDSFQQETQELNSLSDSTNKISKRKFRVIELYKKFGNKEKAIKSVGLSKETYLKWISNDPDFKSKIKNIDNLNDQ
jgi:intein-encoded DNA endonuclease-like protein